MHVGDMNKPSSINEDCTKKPDWVKIEPEILSFVLNYSKECSVKYFVEGAKDQFCPCVATTLSKSLLQCSSWQI